MSGPNLLQYGFFLAVVAVLVKPLGGYMARVFEGQPTFLDRVLLPVERVIYRLTRIEPEMEMDWKQYSLTFIILGLVGTLLLYGILRLQRFLPWFYPAYQTTPVTLDLAMNTAIGFSTTTTWQAYGGENTLRYASQMIGLTVQNFLAGASGLAVGVAFIQGFAGIAIEAQHRTIALVEFPIDKAKLLDRLRGQLNERQEKVLLRMFREGLEGFRGGLAAGKYSTITGASPARVTRDLADLVAKGAPLRVGERRHARYDLGVPLRPVKHVTVNERGEPVES